MMKQANPDTIAQAANLIRQGELVAFPTETVYGLGADATNGAAVAKIFAAKGRPSFNPLIVHVSDATQAEQLVQINKRAREVMAHFWPGPLTLILPLKDGAPVSDLCHPDLDTLAVRCPQHAVARALLHDAGVPIAAPSANRSGHLSPTAPQHVQKSLGEAVPMILADGPCETGLESTVLDLSAETPEILRAGILTLEDIQAVLPDAKIHAPKDEKVKSPGMLLKHYAPSIPVRLNAVDVHEGEALLAFGSTKFMSLKEGGGVDKLPEERLRNLSETGDLYEAASNLFAYMHALDTPENKGIAVMNIPNIGVGIAINDRLKRAAEN